MLRISLIPIYLNNVNQLNVTPVTSGDRGPRDVRLIDRYLISVIFPSLAELLSLQRSDANCA